MHKRRSKTGRCGTELLFGCDNVGYIELGMSGHVGKTSRHLRSDHKPISNTGSAINLIENQSDLNDLLGDPLLDNLGLL